MKFLNFNKSVERLVLLPGLTERQRFQSYWSRWVSSLFSVHSSLSPSHFQVSDSTETRIFCSKFRKRETQYDTRRSRHNVFYTENIPKTEKIFFPQKSTLVELFVSRSKKFNINHRIQDKIEVLHQNFHSDVTAAQISNLLLWKKVM